MKQEHFICPVCGFDGLKEPPYSARKEPSFEICPCCGFEFGYDDLQQQSSYDSFRRAWIALGAEWFMAGQKPPDWDLKRQLRNINYDLP